jgi:hypothetical protein
MSFMKRYLQKNVQNIISMWCSSIAHWRSGFSLNVISLFDIASHHISAVNT